MTVPRPSDGELAAAIADSFASPVAAIERAPYHYATSHPLEEVHVAFGGGERATLILKDLDPARRAPGAVDAKPSFLRQPRREIETYRHLLAGTGIGPRCHAARCDADQRWLLLAKVPGVELWQVGDLDVWGAVVAWLAAFHERFADADAVAARNPYLLARDRVDLDRWRRRSRAALASCQDRRARGLARRLAHVPPPEATVSEHRRLLHGELYPSNVLVGGTAGDVVEVWPVDWEMAAVGPPAFDLAALLTGWDDGVRARLVARYRHQLDHPPPADELEQDIDVCRLHLACQWLGWTPGWQAPAEHAHDWVGEALDAIERLGW